MHKGMVTIQLARPNMWTPADPQQKVSVTSDVEAVQKPLLMERRL